MSTLIVLQGCRTVQLAGGANTLIDETDWELVGSLRWQARITPSGNYASGSIKIPGSKKFKGTSMHRLLLSAPAHLVVDHIDGDGLNNTRENMRLATIKQNIRNRRKVASNSGFKGVHFVANGYRATITADGKKIRLGRFRTGEEAARAYDRAAIQHHGEFAATNAKLGLV